MNNGYVSVPREFFDSIQWRRKRIFTESEAYLDLLQMAYYGSEPTERMVGRRSFIVKRGQIITTTSFLAERWGLEITPGALCATCIKCHFFCHLYCHFGTNDNHCKSR